MKIKIKYIEKSDSATVIENDNYIVECEIKPYRIYTNNLERV